MRESRSDSARSLSVSVPQGISTPITGSLLAARRESLCHIKLSLLQSVTQKTLAVLSNQGWHFSDLPSHPASSISIINHNHVLLKHTPRQELAVSPSPFGADKEMGTWETV